jgi:hypothetical protein
MSFLERERQKRGHTSSEHALFFEMSAHVHRNHCNFLEGRKSLILYQGLKIGMIFLTSLLTFVGAYSAAAQLRAHVIPDEYIVSLKKTVSYSLFLK